MGALAPFVVAVAVTRADAVRLDHERERALRLREVLPLDVTCSAVRERGRVGAALRGGRLAEERHRRRQRRRPADGALEGLHLVGDRACRARPAGTHDAGARARRQDRRRRVAERLDHAVALGVRAPRREAEDAGRVDREAGRARVVQLRAVDARRRRRCRRRWRSSAACRRRPSPTRRGSRRPCRRCRDVSTLFEKPPSPPSVEIPSDRVDRRADEVERAAVAARAGLDAGGRVAAVAAVRPDRGRQRERARGSRAGSRPRRSPPWFGGRAAPPEALAPLAKTPPSDRDGRAPVHDDRAGRAAGRVAGRVAGGRAELGGEDAVARQRDRAAGAARQAVTAAVAAEGLDLVDRERAGRCDRDAAPGGPVPDAAPSGCRRS